MEVGIEDCLHIEFEYNKSKYVHGQLTLIKVALYSFFATRGIGMNGVSARVFKKNFYFDDATKNKGFSVI